VSDVSPEVLLIAGSVRFPSHTRALVTAIADRLTVEGATPRIWDLGARPLPIADPKYHRNPEDHPSTEVRALVSAAEVADALVLATPVYHNGPAGVLKNALDHLLIRHFMLKPVGLVSHGGGRTTQAVEQLRIITRGLHGYAIVTQICTNDHDYETENDKFKLKSKMTVRRVNRFSRELTFMAKVLPYARRALI